MEHENLNNKETANSDLGAVSTRFLSDVIGSNWNTTDYINQKVKNIMWNTDRKFQCTK